MRKTQTILIISVSCVFVLTGFITFYLLNSRKSQSKKTLPGPETRINFSGKILNEKDAPIRDARVILKDLVALKTEARDILQQKTDETGSFSFLNLPCLGTFTLEVQAEGYVPETKEIQLQPKSMKGSVKSVHRNVKLHHGTSITATVTGADGKPGTGTAVTLMVQQRGFVEYDPGSSIYRVEGGTESWCSVQTGVTDEDGRITFEPVKADRTYRLKATRSNPDSVLYSSPRHILKPESFELSFQSSTRIRGQVVDSSGKGIPSFTLYAVNRSHPEHQMLKNIRTPDGSFSVRLPGTGPFYLSITDSNSNLSVQKQSLRQTDFPVTIQLKNGPD